MKKMLLAVLMVIPQLRTMGQILPPIIDNSQLFYDPFINGNGTVFYNMGNDIFRMSLGGTPTNIGFNQSWKPYYDEDSDIIFINNFGIAQIHFKNGFTENLGPGHPSAIVNNFTSGNVFASSKNDFGIGIDSSYLFAFNQSGSVLWQTTISGYIRKLVPSGSNLFCFYDLNGIARFNKYDSLGNLLGTVIIGPCTDLYWCGATALSTGQLAFCFNSGASLMLAMINANLTFTLSVVPVSQQVTIADLLEVNGKLYGGGHGQPNPLAFRLIEWDLSGNFQKFWINNPNWDEHFSCLSKMGIVCTKTDFGQTNSDLAIYPYPVSPAGFMEIENQKTIIAYPNPCTDFVWINDIKFDTTKFPSGVNFIYTPKGTAKIVKL